MQVVSSHENRKKYQMFEKSSVNSQEGNFSKRRSLGNMFRVQKISCFDKFSVNCSNLNLGMSCLRKGVDYASRNNERLGKSG